MSEGKSDIISDQNSAGVETLKGNARRHFLRGTAALISAALLLSAGVFHKFFRFFFGPRLSEAEEGNLLEARLSRMQETIELEKLELERQHDEYILVARLDSLEAQTGKYFTDYQMRPALAFLGANGLPILLSAKCTHLGCTVGNKVNDKDQILCPCHISYFDIKTGDPNPGAPAKSPLDHIGWVLMDKDKKIIASCNADGKTTGNLNHAAIQDTSVYISKRAEVSSS